MEALEQAGNYLPSTKTSLSKRQSEGQKQTPLTMIMLSVSVLEAVALFGRYIRFNLVEQSDNNNVSSLNVNDQSPSMQSKRSAFEVLMTPVKHHYLSHMPMIQAFQTTRDLFLTKYYTCDEC